MNFLLPLLDLRTTLVGIAVFLAMYYFMKPKTRGRFPKGPPALPIVGSIPFMDKDLRVTMRRFHEKYGDLLTVYLAGKPMVVLNGVDSIREAFLGKAVAFSGRPQDIPNFAIHHENRGVGKTTAMGEGKAILEERVTKEVSCFIESLDRQDLSCVDPRHGLTMAVANIIGSMLTGERDDYDDSRLETIATTVQNILAMDAEGDIPRLWPWLRYLPGDLFQLKKYGDNMNFLKQKFAKIIKERRDTYDTSSEPLNIIDAIIKQGAICDPDIAYLFSDEETVSQMYILYAGGTDTSASTLGWAIVYMTNFPEIQTKVQNELDSVIGRDRLPTYADRHLLPYTNAVIMETQRLADIAPFAAPHTTLQDVELRGYFLPKGTYVMPNLNMAHRDPKAWKHPESFYPGHFITDDGEPIQNDSFLPFGLGKRSCPGIEIGKMELFLFFTTLFQRYTFRQAKGEPLPGMEGHLGITVCPKPFKVAMEKR